MKIEITITDDKKSPSNSLIDVAKGAIGYDNRRQDKPNPMLPDTTDAKYEAGYDASGWSGKFKEYTVKAGDTAESIAKAHGCSTHDLVMLNRKNGSMFSDQVNEGQCIKVPIMES